MPTGFLAWEIKMSSKSIFEIQADFCRCMSNAVRIEIIYVLRSGPQRVSEIARMTNYGQTMISRHLTQLRNSGVVSSHREGQEVICHIANQKIVEICDLMREVLKEEASRRSKLTEGFQEEFNEGFT
jgi:ArsR family transcriptional regulator, virulence genes transcriptional regulator